MVDQIRSGTVKSPMRVGATVRTGGSLRAGSEPATVVAAPTLAQSLAAAPPIDLERVARIRQAVIEGNFPLSPTTVADRLIALRYEWMGNDEA